MDRITAELAAAMTGLERDGDGWRAAFRLPPAFVGFAGHFPGRPITPAVAQIQMGCLVLAAGTGLSPCPQPGRVDAAKFTRPLGPEEALTVRVLPAGTKRWKAFVLAGNERAAEFTLSFEDAP